MEVIRELRIINENKGKYRLCNYLTKRKIGLQAFVIEKKEIFEFQ